ncbi:MAG TPA: FtsX-like permease family protein [Solirubrobacteraceae bacterium]|jgi:putative ABC transport system permease protein|nr:FtsX-like permease family protein [Solirubrobacteraceae bacterium]
MNRVVVRGFFSRRLRAVLTGIAIALGVALISGTYILTDTIDSSFASLFSTSERNRSVVVVPHQGFGATASVQTSLISDATLAKVRRVPGVALAAGEVFTPVSLFANGKRLNKSAANFVSSVVPPRFENFSAVAGRLPSGAGEVGIDQATAQRYSLHVGQSMRVAGQSSTVIDRLAGILKFAGSTSFGGAGVAVLPLAQAQRIAGESHAYDELLVAGASSISDATLRARIRAVLPKTLDVRTGVQEANQQTSDLESQLGVLRTLLLVFGYIALFVGAFIIFNTFSITVAQRTREFGLLRTLGATRGQILGSVVAEGVMLGIGGSIVGILAGLGVAPALDELFKVLGADIPDNGTVLEARTIWVSLIAGTLVTVIAGLLPALRASRVTPVAALREGVALQERSPRSRRRRAIGLVVIVAVILIRFIAELKSGAGVVTIVVILGIVIAIRVPLVRKRIGRFFSAIVVGVAHALSRLIAWRGITGRLARDNTVRHPGRTAVTATSLMIGLALVTLIAVLAAGTKASINNAIDASFAGNLIVTNSSTAGNEGIPSEIPAAVRKLPGVARVTAVAFTEAKIRGVSGTKTVTAVETSTFAQMYRINWDSGSNATLRNLGMTGAVVNKNTADGYNLHVGQTLSVQTPSGRRISLVVRGIATDNVGLLAALTISLPLARSAFAQRTDAVDFIGYQPGVTDAQVQPKVNRLLGASFPQAESQTAKQFEATQANQINKLLALIYVLLALSVIVSLFGIVNTLVLSIYERTRELGMLRAIGTSRRQIREMIRYESVITALVGGILGIVLGIGVAGILSATVLTGGGFVFVIPLTTIVVLFVLAALAGLAAAAWPARRAARVDILAAIATE